MKTKFLATFFLTFAVFTTCFAQSFDKARLDQFFDALAAKDKAMGSLAIARDGKIIYSRAVGYSSISGNNKSASTTATKYRIGSISKMFTATMIFQLVEAGKLKLTDTLDKFFPNIKNAKLITIGSMLNHHSGIYNFTDDADYLTYLAQPKTHDEMLAVIAKGSPAFAPNAKAGYSNSNFVLLGYIIEKLDGKTYAESLKDRITSKINLSDTYYGGKTNARANEAFSYSFISDWKPAGETDMSIPGGAGAIVATPSDLTKFIDALFAGKLVSQASLRQMQTPTDNYGMGMFQLPLDGKKAFGHTGGIDGFNSIVLYLPEDKLAIAYTSNGMSFDISEIILAAYYAAAGKPVTIPTFEAIKIAPADLDKLSGVYSNPTFPIKVTITNDKTTLFVQGTGQPMIPLEAAAPNKFKFDPAGLVLEFDRARNQMTLKQGGQEVVLTKEQ